MGHEDDQRRIRVVVVDDHEPFRRALLQLLALDAEIDVVGAASDGQEAYERCMELQPDVALLDLAMPNVDGGRASRNLRRDAPNVKIVIFSVFSQEHCLRRGLEFGADRYLTKGISPREILATVKAVAAEKRANDQALRTTTPTTGVPADHLRRYDRLVGVHERQTTHRNEQQTTFERR